MTAIRWGLFVLFLYGLSYIFELYGLSYIFELYGDRDMNWLWKHTFEDFP